MTSLIAQTKRRVFRRLRAAPHAVRVSIGCLVFAVVVLLVTMPLPSALQRPGFFLVCAIVALGFCWNVRPTVLRLWSPLASTALHMLFGFVALVIATRMVASATAYGANDFPLTVVLVSGFVLVGLWVTTVAAIACLLTIILFALLVRSIWKRQSDGIRLAAEYAHAIGAFGLFALSMSAGLALAGAMAKPPGLIRGAACFLDMHVMPDMPGVPSDRPAAFVGNGVAVVGDIDGYDCAITLAVSDELSRLSQPSSQ